MNKWTYNTLKKIAHTTDELWTHPTSLTVLFLLNFLSISCLISFTQILLTVRFLTNWFTLLGGLSTGLFHS